jgi:fatty-acyl-CoA synthase
VTVEILDANGDAVPRGDIGRIFVGSGGAFEGYTNGGDKERVRGMLSSGDMGRFVDGLLFVEGRDDDMIVSGGENVFPAEVEELLHGHDAVADVAVFGVADEQFGQRLKAVIVKRDSLSESDVKDYVKRNLAGYKAPRDVVFVDELPRTSTGKVLKRDLRDAS